MSSSPCLLLQPNLLTIVPGNITIENFVPGRVYKQTITIYNTCHIPIIINLRSSDKSKLIIDKTLLRIEVNESQKVDLVIQDKINYAINKLPTKPKKLFVIIKGELIDEKFEINLLYFSNKNTGIILPQNNSNPKMIIMNNNNNIISNNNNKINDVNDANNNLIFKQVPSNYLAQCQNRLYSPNNMNYFEISPRNNNNTTQNNDKLFMEKNFNFTIQRTECGEVKKLKTIINNLMKELSEYKGNMKNNINSNANKDFNNYMKNNFNNINDDYATDKSNNFINFSETKNSLFILGHKFIDNDERFKIDCEIEKNAAIAQNKILLVENSALAKRIKILEDEIAHITSHNQNNFSEPNNPYSVNNYNFSNLYNNDYSKNLNNDDYNHNLSANDYLERNNQNITSPEFNDRMDYGLINQE